MSESRAASGMDRLPWLADEPKVHRVRRTRDYTGWAAAAVLAVAGASFWLGTRSEAPETQQTAVQPKESSTVQPLAPQPQVRIAPQQQVTPAPEPEVRSAPVPEVRSTPEPSVRMPRRVVERATPAPEREEAHATEPKPIAPVAAAPPAPRPAPLLRSWPPRVIVGAAGRLVQIGAYGSTLQAKRGWVAMVRAYPAVQHLPAVVVQSRNSHGRLFYRFQIGTTSHAHSEVLCQRMQRIQLSCAVVGLPWKAKVER